MSDEKLVHKVTQILDDGIETLDAESRSALTRARHAAINQSAQTPRRRWATVGGIAVAAILVVALSLRVLGPTDLAVQDSALEDIELLSSAESLEFYQDLDFYDWLSNAESAG